MIKQLNNHFKFKLLKYFWTWFENYTNGIDRRR